jgi:hypothetical protein
VEWGPVAVWAGAAATVLAVAVAILAAVGAFDRFGAPRVALTFESGEPWTRLARRGMERVLWVRVGVENGGSRPARGCVGRMMVVFTDNAETVARSLVVSVPEVGKEVVLHLR